MEVHSFIRNTSWLFTLLGEIYFYFYFSSETHDDAADTGAYGVSLSFVHKNDSLVQNI